MNKENIDGEDGVKVAKNNYFSEDWLPIKQILNEFFESDKKDIEEGISKLEGLVPYSVSDEFTEKLNSHMRGIVTPPIIDIKKSSTQNSPVKQDISGKNKEKKTNIKKTNQKRNNKETEKKEIFYQKWDGITDRNVLSNYFEKVKELYNSANYQLNKKVVGNMPILWFGDHEKYIKSHVKIVTVGYNPSDKEFSKQRFGNLANKTINEISLEEYINALNSYFYNTPYREWFGQFKWYLQQFGASFENGVMHIDLYSAIATSPTWKGLSDEEKEIVSQRDICNGLLFDFLKPDVILCNFDIRELNIEYESNWCIMFLSKKRL